MAKLKNLVTLRDGEERGGGGEEEKKKHANIARHCGDAGGGHASNSGPGIGCFQFCSKICESTEYVSNSTQLLNSRE